MSPPVSKALKTRREGIAHEQWIDPFDGAVEVFAIVTCGRLQYSWSALDEVGSVGVQECRGIRELPSD